MKKHRGFTVVELLIYLGLLAIFLVVLLQIFVATLDLSTESAGTGAVEEDSRYVLARLSYDIGRAAQIDLPATIGETVNVLQLTVGGVVYRYANIAGALTLSDGAGTDRLTSSETTLTNISFQRLGNIGGKAAVKITLGLSSVAPRPGTAESKTVQTTVGLR